MRFLLIVFVLFLLVSCSSTDGVKELKLKKIPDNTKTQIKLSDFILRGFEQADGFTFVGSGQPGKEDVTWNEQSGPLQTGSFNYKPVIYSADVNGKIRSYFFINLLEDGSVVDAYQINNQLFILTHSSHDDKKISKLITLNTENAVISDKILDDSSILDSAQWEDNIVVLTSDKLIGSNVNSELLFTTEIPESFSTSRFSVLDDGFALIGHKKGTGSKQQLYIQTYSISGNMEEEMVIETKDVDYIRRSDISCVSRNSCFVHYYGSSYDGDIYFETMLYDLDSKQSMTVPVKNIPSQMKKLGNNMLFLVSDHDAKSVIVSLYDSSGNQLWLKTLNQEATIKDAIQLNDGRLMLLGAINGEDNFSNPWVEVITT